MIELVAIIFITVIILTVSLQLYFSVHSIPRPVELNVPTVSIERLNWLYVNDYQDFLTVKKELEERGWRVIFIENETLG